MRGVYYRVVNVLGLHADVRRPVADVEVDDWLLRNRFARRRRMLLNEATLLLLAIIVVVLAGFR